MIIHRGLTIETALEITVKHGLMAYIDEDITKHLDEMFGAKNGDYYINVKHPVRENPQGEKFVIIQIEDKDTDQHTLYFKLNIV
jgi:hypothetical protein